MYDKQYLIARSAQRIPATYDVSRFGPWFVGSAKDLERVEVVLPDGHRLLLVGHPIDIAGSLERLRSRGDLAALDDLAGTFIVLLESSEGVELRLDASGSLPAVYAPEHGVVAAHPGLIHECAEDAELVSAFSIHANAFFPFDLTPKRGVLRLLPNHHLLLTTMRTERLWPKTLVEGVHSPEENVAFIAERLERTITALSDRGPLSLPLTGGYDSRALLACAGPVDRAHITTFTSMIDQDALADAAVAEKLAAMSGIHHCAVAYVEPTAAERRSWLDSTGQCVGGRASYNFKTVASQTRGKILCMGLAGEVGRTFFSRRQRRGTKPTAELLLYKLRLPRHNRGLEAGERWLSGLRGFDVLQVLDLLYMEVRLGCWAGPQMIAEGPCSYRVAPFNQRAIFERALDIPFELRRKDYTPAAIVRLERPELAHVPYNAAARSLRKRLSGLRERARSFLGLGA
jgi:hypothetical protein